jgi:hypothetical protein
MREGRPLTARSFRRNRQFTSLTLSTLSMYNNAAEVSLPSAMSAERWYCPSIIFPSTSATTAAPPPPPHTNNNQGKKKETPQNKQKKKKKKFKK